MPSSTKISLLLAMRIPQDPAFCLAPPSELIVIVVSDFCSCSMSLSMFLSLMFFMSCFSHSSAGAITSWIVGIGVMLVVCVLSLKSLDVIRMKCDVCITLIGVMSGGRAVVVVCVVALNRLSVGHDSVVADGYTLIGVVVVL